MGLNQRQYGAHIKIMHKKYLGTKTSPSSESEMLMARFLPL